MKLFFSIIQARRSKALVLIDKFDQKFQNFSEHLQKLM
jgi:hypothetical protein